MPQLSDPYRHPTHQCGPLDVHIVYNGAIIVGTLNAQAVAEMKQLLQRGLNTWDSAPAWLFKLDEVLAAHLGR